MVGNIALGNINLINWLDLLWIPIGFFAVNKEQRLKVVGFIGICIIMLRLQVELFIQMGLEYGYFTFLHNFILYRGFWVYGVLIAAFIVLSRLSPNTNPFVYIAASISVFIFGFCLSSAIMIL